MAGSPPPPPLNQTPPSGPGGSGLNEDNNQNNDSPNLQEMILSQVASLTQLIKQHNALGGSVLKPIRLDFGDEGIGDKGKEKPGVNVDDDLCKPFKEVARSPFTRRIVEFTGSNYAMPLHMRIYDGTTDPNDHLTRFAGAANGGEWPMPVWCRMFQQTLDGAAGGWFE